MDKAELQDQRQFLRKPSTKDAREKVQQAHGNQYSAITMLEAEQDVDHLLREDERKLASPVQKRSVRHQPKPGQKQPKRDYERESVKSREKAKNPIASFQTMQSSFGSFPFENHLSFPGHYTPSFKQARNRACLKDGVFSSLNEHLF